MKKSTTTIVCILWTAFLLAGTSWAAPISEPSTVFYGKVTGIGGAQPFLVTDGILEWTIRKADGNDLFLRAPLYPLNDGEYSYRLNVPHSAFAFDLEDQTGIPLPPIPQTNLHVRATVDGEDAVFSGPSGASFAAGQATRAATYRLDLELSRVPVDSDGDGIPDWWEDQYGFDKQSLTDAFGDADGDGVSNLDEYLRGLNPRFDSRVPVLTSTEFLAYAGCTTGVRLETEDVDSASTNLFYTLITLPANGQLRLRNQTPNPTEPDQDLVAGASFTQEDVDTGRLVFVHEADPVTRDEFVLSVRDDVHAASIGTVEISFYEPSEEIPATLREQRQYRSYQAGLHQNAIIRDGMDCFDPVMLAAPSSGLTGQEYADVYLPSFGNERGQMMTGGRDDDELNGGMADDTLVGGTGTDVLTGCGGADWFVFDENDLGFDTITDFAPEEGDVIDLSGVLDGASGMVDDYLNFGWDGTNTLLGVSLAGAGGDFTNLVLTLEGIQIDRHRAYELVLQGDVLAGALQLQPRLSVAVLDAEASENGDNSGSFVLSRTGALGGELDVTISLGGSADNGIDYSELNTELTFAAGIREITLFVNPFADSMVESAETVELVLQSGSDYCVHVSDRASLTIQDLQAVVGIEVLEDMGTKDPLIPATVLIKRNGQTANSLLVHLSIGGNAQNGSDYQYVSTYVNFSANQTTVPIDLLPLSGGVLSGGSEIVLISISEDESYALADVSDARVILADRRDTLADWQDREFSDSTETPAEFAVADPGDTGIDNLQRYAFGMNPLAPERSRIPKIAFRDGYCCVDVSRNPAAVDVEFIVEVSTDLANWDSSSSAVVKVVAPEYEATADVETYQAVSPMVVTPKLFMRVRLIYRP